MQWTVQPAGDRGSLVDVPGATAAWLQAAAGRVRRCDGVVACIIGESSLLVIGGGSSWQPALSFDGTSAAAAPRVHRIAVSFAPQHALDLDELLARIDVSREVFLERMNGLRLTVRYLGFRAGFGYLEGWPAEWTMPRRPTSRTRVPRGSFAIAGGRAGFYPIDSPGGWNILGKTEAPLWDPWREPPNLFAPGDAIELEVLA